VDVVTRAANLSPTQHHRGPEARAEQGALAWAGPEAGFVDLLTYREALETRQRNAPIVALVQAEGVLDLLEGPGSHELAGPLVERIRNAASDSRVRGIVVRISTVAASDEALRMVVQAADKARRSGKPVGISFGPLVPAGVASVQANIPMSAPTGALLVNLAPGGEATALASRVRYPWRVRDGERALSGLPAETAFLQQGAVMATVVAGEALSAAMADLPDDGVNDLPNAEAQGSAVQVAWQNDVGSLLDMKDRLTDGRRGDLLLAPYERRSSVWSRTRTRFEKLRIRITNLFTGRSRNSSE